jgi:hypothetical protein
MPVQILIPVPEERSDAREIIGRALPFRDRQPAAGLGPDREGATGDGGAAAAKKSAAG